MVVLMNYFQFLLMPLLGAFIGWSTNLLAIKLIFWPLKPVKIPLLGIEIQGLIPKRRFDISKNIGETIEKEILSPDEIVNRFASENIKNQLIMHIKNFAIERSREKLPAFFPSGFRTAISDYIGEVIDRQGGTIFERLKGILMEKAKNEFDLKTMVEEKLNSMNLEQLEDIILRLSKKELKQIEILGGIIGFVVGLIQAVASYYLSFLR